MLVGAGTLLLWAATAPAQPPAAEPTPEWQEVQGATDFRVYVDRRSIRRDGDSLRFRGRIVRAQADQHGVLTLRHLGEISCARREYRIVTFEALDAAGTVVLSFTVPESTAPMAIDPGSNNEALHREFCG
jgi:hypothetical protein